MGDQITRTDPREFDSANLKETASGIQEQLQEWNAKKIPLVLAVGGKDCVAVPFVLPSARQARQRQALGYVLEASLPWAAEECVADYDFQGGRALGYALPVEPLKCLLDDLEEKGIRVVSVTPLARLALQSYLKKSSPPKGKWCTVWGSSESIDLWLLEHRTPLLWRHLPADLESVQREIRQLQLQEQGGTPGTLIGLPPDWGDQLGFSSIHIQAAESETAQTLLESVSQILPKIAAGAEAPAIEFRRDVLSSGGRNQALGTSLRILQVSLLLLFLGIGGSLYRYGEEFNRRRLLAADQQQSLFRQLFPEVPVPVGVRSRLESERAKLAGLSGETDDLPQQISALKLIEKFLKSLPSGLRYRILEIRIEQGKLYLVGQVRDHADADKVAEGLKKSGLNSEAPSTHRLPQQGVEFRISAELAAPNTQTADKNPREGVR